MNSYYPNDDPNTTLSVHDQLVIQAFAKVDTVALGLASGLIGAVGIFLATLILLIKGGDPVGPNLALLGQYLSATRSVGEAALLAHCTVFFPHSPWDGRQPSFAIYLWPSMYTA